MIPRPDNYVVHHFPLPIKVSEYLSTTVAYPTQQFHLCGKNLFRTAEKLSRRVSARRVRSRSSQSRVALGAVACVLYRQFRFRNEQKSAVRNRQARTKLSVTLPRSQRAGSVSVISRASHGLQRPKQISLILPVTTGAHAGDGLRVIPSRLLRLLASSSPKS